MSLFYLLHTKSIKKKSSLILAAYAAKNATSLENNRYFNPLLRACLNVYL